MKRFCIFLVSIGVAFSLVGCGSEKEDSIAQKDVIEQEVEVDTPDVEVDEIVEAEDVEEHVEDSGVGGTHIFHIDDVSYELSFDTSSGNSIEVNGNGFDVTSADGEATAWGQFVSKDGYMEFIESLNSTGTNFTTFEMENYAVLEIYHADDFIEYSYQFTLDNGYLAVNIFDIRCDELIDCISVVKK